MKKRVSMLLVAGFAAAVLLSFGCGGSTSAPAENVTVDNTSDVTITIDGETVPWTAPVVVEFSDTISTPDDWSSVLTLTQIDGDGANLCPSSAIVFANNTLTCSPAAGLSPCEQYTVTLSGLLDATGKAIAETTKTLSVMRVDGDLNGDGYADVLIGNPVANDDDSGALYILYGAASGMDGIVDKTLQGFEADGYLGWRISTHGDFNNDCVADMLVGSPYVTANGHGANEAYIYFGGSSPSATPDVYFKDGSGTDRFGSSVTAADFDNDGNSDAVISASFTNKTYVYYGPITAGDKTYDLLLTTGGSAVAAGHFNNDSYEDLAAGNSDVATVYVYYGSADGLTSTVGATLTDSVLSTSFGASLSSADLDGDGYDDLIVGADTTNSLAGAIHVFYGSASGISTTVGFTIAGGSINRLTYFGSLSAADFNGDGYDDIIAGELKDAVSERSNTYIYFGSANLPSTTPDVTFYGNTTYAPYLSAGDFDADGRADAVIQVNNPGNVGAEIYFGSADMSETPTADITIESECSSLAGGSSP